MKMKIKGKCKTYWKNGMHLQYYKYEQKVKKRVVGLKIGTTISNSLFVNIYFINSLTVK